MYAIDKVKADLRDAREKLSVKIGKRDLLRQQRDAAVIRKAEAEQQLGQYDLVQILLQKTSDYARQQAKIRMEQTVTEALNIVFHDKHYRFEIRLDVRSNQPIAEYWLESSGVWTQLKPPDYDRGGGAVDIISLALRLAIGELVGAKGPLFLDEIGKHVSAEYIPNVAYFLKEYSRRFNRQIVLITHNKHLAEIGDLSLHVTQRNGESRVTKL
jgi:DNA repair exonuclease SbcCD ATPase subunit